MKTVRFLLAVGAICLATAVSRPALAGRDEKAAPRIVRVSIVSDPRAVGRYKPATLVVHRGQRVVFRNVSNAPHTVSADNGSFDSGTIYVGKSWTYTARKVGTFTYFCQFHFRMHGKIIVRK